MNLEDSPTLGFLAANSEHQQYRNRAGRNLTPETYKKLRHKNFLADPLPEPLQTVVFFVTQNA